MTWNLFLNSFAILVSLMALQIIHVDYTLSSLFNVNFKIVECILPHSFIACDNSMGRCFLSTV